MGYDEFLRVRRTQEGFALSDLVDDETTELSRRSLLVIDGKLTTNGDFIRLASTD